MISHLSVKSPVAMFYLAVWHLTHQTSHSMCSFFLSFLLLKCAPSLFALEKNAWLWSTIFTSYWAEAREQWWQKRERGRKNKIEKHTLRVYESDGVSRNMFSGSRCVPEGLELLLLWPRSCKRGGAGRFCCSYFSPDTEDENRTDLCCFTPTHSTSKLSEHLEEHEWAMWQLPI